MFLMSCEMPAARAQAFGPAQHLLAGPQLLAHASLAELALQRRHQARGVALEDEVVDAEVHGLDRCLLADGARHDDEGHVAPALLHDAERRRGIELRHGVVAQHEVPVRRGQRIAQRWLGVDAAPVGLEPGALESPHRQRGVVFVVLDEKDAKRPGHVTSPEVAG
jgi:hypothetical protein